MPALGGSALSFGLLVLKELGVYIKHKKRRVRDFEHDYLQLYNENNQLSSRWADMNVRIKHQSTAVRRGQEHSSLENKVKMVAERFTKIREQCEKLCGGDLTKIREKRIWTRKFYKLASLDKDVVKLLGIASAVLNGLKFEALIVEKEPSHVEELHAQELDNLVSHQKHLDNLLALINEGNKKRIGIYGVPGIGKTNIMKNLNNWFLSPSNSNYNHDYVIWVTVEKKAEDVVESIQKEIMARLKLPEGRSRSHNKGIISETLSEKKYLVLLDNFPPGVDLEEIGITCKHHMLGKVVMAAKNIKELRNVQKDEVIEIGVLSPEESKSLFKKFIGCNEFSAEEINIVDPILKVLGGIPEYIETIANQLRSHRNNLLYWQGVKQRLESDASTPAALGFAQFEKFYSSLYNDLENNFKRCLLYATLYPKEYMIPKNNLFECWKAEKLLESYPTFIGELANGEFVLVHLKERSLLKIPSEKYVTVPVLIRKLAIARWNREEFGSEAPCIGGHEAEEGWHTARWISLIRCNVRELSMIPAENSLSTLLLQKNPCLESIKEAFFSRMLRLLVLDLHGTRIKLLPPSVSSLVSLRCLYLNGCRYLEMLPNDIGQLEKLEVLDIRYTSIRRVPDEVCQLVSLRCLRISYAFEPQEDEVSKVHSQKWLIFPPVKRNKLSNLEKLTIDFGMEVDEEVLQQVQSEVETTFIKRIDLDLNRKCNNLSSLEQYFEENLNDETNRSEPLYILPDALNLQSDQQLHNDELPTLNQYLQPASDKGKGIVQPEQECLGFRDPLEKNARYELGDRESFSKAFNLLFSEKPTACNEYDIELTIRALEEKRNQLPHKRTPSPDVLDIEGGEGTSGTANGSVREWC